MADEVKRMNDAPILDQIDGQYEKLLLMVLRKYVPEGATITDKDMAQQINDPRILLVMGRFDAVTFKCVTAAEGERMAKHNKATHEGRA